LQDYLKKVHQNNEIAPYGTVELQNGDHREIRFTCCCDYVALKAAFPTEFCIWCDANKFKPERCSMKEPLKVIPGSVFHIYKINIRPCLLHLKKRLVENFLSKLLTAWSTGPKRKARDKQARLEAKYQWQRFCTSEKIGLTDYVLPSTCFKMCSLTGDKAERFLLHGLEGIKHLDPNGDTHLLWKKMVNILRQLETKKKKKTDENEILTLETHCMDFLKLHLKRFFPVTKLTPYLHITLSHAAEFQREGLKSGLLLYHYTGEALESANHKDQSSYHKNTNQGGGSKVLVTKDLFSYLESKETKLKQKRMDYLEKKLIEKGIIRKTKMLHGDLLTLCLQYHRARKLRKDFIHHYNSLPRNSKEKKKNVQFGCYCAAV
jgi:hypothetical protein